MIELIHEFGDKKNVIVILMFISSFFLMVTLFRIKKVRFLFSFLFALFISLQLISLYFTQSFIDYQFYTHFNIGAVTGISGLFIPHIFFILIFFIGLFLIFYFSGNISDKINSKFKINRPIRLSVLWLIVIVNFTVILQKSSIVNDTKSIITVFNTSNYREGFKSVLSKNNILNYTTPDKVESKAGKNIVILSIESLEKSFLSKKFSELTPNLNKLKNSWNYSELEENEGSNWTSGSLYTCLTGFPAFFGVQANTIFDKVYSTEISSISHVLKKANYNTIFLNGDASFSGVDQMLNAFKFDKIIDKKKVWKQKNESFYGLRDKDLFELAKREIDLQKKSNQPFAMFISTTDTHFPNGIYDDRMESIISKKNSELEFMVAAVDYMIGDFISYLKEKKLLENTVVYIFPDHLKMGDPSMFENTGGRGLYVISNSKNNNLKKSDNEKLYQIDLPKIILDGAEIEHNLKFLTDYIEGDKNQYIKDNLLGLTEINTNGLLRIDAKPFEKKEVSKDYENYKKDTLRFIAHAGGGIDGKIYTNSKEALDLNYRKGFRLFELDIIKTKEGKFVAAHDWKNWSKITKFKGELPALYDEFISCEIYEKYTPLDMPRINEWFSLHKDAILVTDKINEPVEFASQFKFKNRLIMELFDMNAVKLGLKAEILSVMPSESVINGIDKEDVEDFAKMGIKNIAISRRFIDQSNRNKKLLLEFKKHNIKPYAYEINSDTGVNDEYVLKYQMDYFYGMYIDSWSF